MLWINKKNGKLYIAICEATHSETQEEYIVYTQANVDNGKTWVRPKALFLEKFERYES